MANQIASFFKAMPHDEAVAGVAKHINDFWDPRMRRQFFEIVEAGGPGLSPLVVDAVPKIRTAGTRGEAGKRGLASRWQRARRPTSPTAAPPCAPARPTAAPSRRRAWSSVIEQPAMSSDVT